MVKATISIIIPVYNSEKYLSRCLDSILSQTYQFTELILVDDGSKDNSGIICDQYALKDKRIQVYHKLNAGASAARNFGLSKAKGDYVSFIDSDDWISPAYYESFFKGEDFLYDIYFQNYVLHNSDGSIEVKEIRPWYVKNSPTDDAILYLMKEVKFGWSWIKLFKRSIISDHQLKFDESINLREDELFSLQYCKYIKSIRICSFAGYHYYIYSNSLTRSFRDPLEHIRISKILRNEAYYIQAVGIQKYEDNYFLMNLYMSVLQMYINGALPGLQVCKRLSVIKEFLDFYHSKQQGKLSYKSFASKLLYMILWNVKSPRLIDLIMQKWFHVKYDN